MFYRNSFMPKEMEKIKTFNCHRELFYKAFKAHEQNE